MRQQILVVLISVGFVSSAACASLGRLAALISAPRFEQAADREAELRVLSPSRDRAAGGAAVRIWTRVENPNPFGIRLTRLDGTLFLEASRAATVDFPLGLPLGAGENTVIPIDVGISFADLPRLGGALQQILTGSDVVYEIEGNVTVDAGRLGTPTFGPARILTGKLRVLR